MDEKKNDSDETQLRMAELRRIIGRQVRMATHDAKEWFDWRKQIARHPVASIAVAAALGFMLVPRRRRAELPAEPSTNGHLAHKGLLPMVTPPPPQPHVVRSVLQGLIATGISIALNRAVQALSHRAANSFLFRPAETKTSDSMDEPQSKRNY